GFTEKPTAGWAAGNSLPLALLVPRVLANDAHHSATADDAAILADLLHAGSYLHRSCSCCEARHQRHSSVTCPGRVLRPSGKRGSLVPVGDAPASQVI